MSVSELNPSLGKEIIAQHQAELEKALGQLLGAMGDDRSPDDISEFFHSLMGGFWDPFQEVCSACDRQQKELSGQIIALEDELKASLDEDNFSRLIQYSDLMAERNTTALDYAFLVGYQFSMQFLVMGLLPANKIFFDRRQET